MEALYAEALLWLHGFHTSERYCTLLDEYFLRSTADAIEKDIYFQLEECSSSVLDTVGRLTRYLTHESAHFDVDAFGKRLFSSLKVSYDADSLNMEVFGKRCCVLWHALPVGICMKEPFHVLIYGDEPLSWGDEEQARMLYEKAFSFYVRKTDE
jgi:hypothetical protein